MISISYLFYSTDSEKQTLHKRITPSKEQQEMQQEYWNNLVEYIKTDLADVSGYPISSWIQGSYKFGTQTRPISPNEEFDIDLGIYFNWEGNPDDSQYSAYDIKSLAQESLLKYATESQDDVIEVVSPPKKRCSRIRFKENFHIDIPSYHIDPEQDNRSLATEENIWEDSDPKALYLWFREKCSEEDSNLIRRLIRYFKIWAAINIEKDKRPSTIMLTVLMAEAFVNLTADEQGNGDDVAFRFVIEEIVNRLNSNAGVSNPVNNSENLNRLDVNSNRLFLEKLNELLNLAKKAISCNNDLESAGVWQEVFGHFFPLPVIENDNKQNALVPIQFDPQVSIIATSKNNINSIFCGKNEISSIPRNCEIKFKLDNYSNLPIGSYVEWVVRNEGQEAEFKNDLGHMAGSNLEASEHSAYAGTHYMDVVVKSPVGVIIGFRRIPVNVSGQFMPPRNPVKKPWNGHYKK